METRTFGRYGCGYRQGSGGELGSVLALVLDFGGPEGIQ